VGFVALTDAAPFAVAEARGFFRERGLRVELRREIGWATIRDKIIYGELDAAHAPAPMLWSAQLGINCPTCDVLTALVLNLNGNAITLSRALWDAGARDDAGLRALVRDRKRRHQPVTLGVVFPFSSHHLLLRSWLRGLELDPDREVRIVVVPPAQVFRNLAAGTIDGFCAGEPWNSFAVREGIGVIRVCSAVQQPGHIEKVLMVTRLFAETRSPEHAALVAALADACAWCDEPQHRDALAELLSGAPYLNTATRVISPALSGRIDLGANRTENIADFHVFQRGDTNLPTAAKAAAIQAALVEADLLPAADAHPDLPRQLFREDLHREILAHHQPNELATSSILRGVAS
jgi:ABC-type nitrate/sulfonate/bicarbonate transport system substrate-binding protein